MSPTSLSGVGLGCAYAGDMWGALSSSGCLAMGFYQGHISDAKILVSPAPDSAFSQKPAEREARLAPNYGSQARSLQKREAAGTGPGSATW